MKFTQHYTVKWHDTDANRQVRPSQVLIYMQETANLHLLSQGMSLDDLRDGSGLAFLLSSITMVFYEPLRAYDEIDVETWVCSSRGLSFNRCFRILKGDHAVAEAFSVWALMDLSTRRLLHSEEYPYPFDPEPALELPVPRRVRIPSAQEMEEAGTRRIVYSDLDYNGHMNNTRYPDLLCDFTPSILEKSISVLSLSFLHEAAFGRTLHVYRSVPAGVSGSAPTADPSPILFRTVGEDGVVCLEAALYV